MNIINETTLMSRKMQMRWNDLDNGQMTNKTNNKPSDADDDVANPNVTSKNKSANSDLYQALFPIYYIGKLFGVFPIRFVREMSGRYQGRLSIIDSSYSLCLMASLISAQIWGFWSDLRHGRENSSRLKSQRAIIFNVCDTLGLMSLMAVSIIGSIMHWQQVQTIIDKLIDCDKKLGILSPKKLRRHTILLTFCSLSYFIILSCLDVYSWNYRLKLNKKLDNKALFNYLPLLFMYIIFIMMEDQYAIIVYNVGQRFFRINKTLENILKSSKITNQFRKDLGLAGDFRNQGQFITYIRQEMIGNTRMFRKSKLMDSIVANDGRSFTDRISQLMTVHATLCDTVSLINTVYGVIVLVITVTCLMRLILSPYGLIMEDDVRRESLFFAVQGLWCILHFWTLLMIVEPTYATTMQGKKTAVLLLHCPLEFSACGLFTLDRSLVTSIAGAVTTYLVILIQFQKEDETKGNFDNILKNATQILKNATTLHNITAGRLGP
ncbi:gustatory receptor for sugar taste 43a isoform X2 [Camponotus floridanus]|uniref:gustatory receptor for sugar taste 43a isoform X2 n=1 Tax=Camponotus floridanus TaxID=104421 RepID=UPI000DC6B24D|nr:gustatory receptor for sugar taste 43a isoform X2 [Camponotus floridanus]